MSRAQLDSGRPSSVGALAAVHVAFAAVALAAFAILTNAFYREIMIPGHEGEVIDLMWIYPVVIVPAFWPAVGLAYLLVCWRSIRRWGPRWLRRAAPWLLALVGLVSTAPLGVWTWLASRGATSLVSTTTLACCVCTSVLGALAGFTAGRSAQSASASRGRGVPVG